MISRILVELDGSFFKSILFKKNVFCLFLKIKSNLKMEISKICRLCLYNNGESINLFGETGKALKIASIVSQHFWFEVHIYIY